MTDITTCVTTSCLHCFCSCAIRTTCSVPVCVLFDSQSSCVQTRPTKWTAQTWLPRPPSHEQSASGAPLPMSKARLEQSLQNLFSCVRQSLTNFGFRTLGTGLDACRITRQSQEKCLMLEHFDILVFVAFYWSKTNFWSISK